ncbi:MAG: hypothetical protein IPK67_19125 [Planctomycetes bacterium]|nr:hypothetical protein [Planctomycetota bacterium]
MNRKVKGGDAERVLDLRRSPRPSRRSWWRRSASTPSAAGRAVRHRRAPGADGSQPFQDIQNFWFKDPKTGEIIKNPQRPLVQDLDSLGFPDREVIYDAGAVYRDADRKVFVSRAAA